MSDPYKIKHHKNVQQDDSAIDFGGPGFTWCEYCGALYNTKEWFMPCELDAYKKGEMND